MIHLVAVVVPAYNEAKVIVEVIREIQAAGDYLVIVVDDGSSDDTSAKVEGLEGVIVLRQRINRGKGAATKTGIVAAMQLMADIIVTLDGDGQHDPKDIECLIQPIICDGYDVVLGTRMTQSAGMPFFKVVANKIGNFITLLLYGIYVSDSQSGFRAYSHYAATKIDTRADKYEYDSKVIREINNNRLKFKEVPVKVRYTEHSMSKPQKQGLVNGLKTLARMIWDMVV